MKRLLATTAVSVALISGATADPLTPAQIKSAKVIFGKMINPYLDKVPGRSFDYDGGKEFSVEMEDGTGAIISIVPANITADKIAEICVNPYTDSEGKPHTAKTTGELTSNPKRGFKTLVCTTEAEEWSTRAAERRKETAISLAKMDASEDQDADGFKIKLGKRSNAYGIGISQNLTVTNNGSGKWSFVNVDCAFYYKGEQVGTGGGIVANLYPGKTKPVAVMGLQIDKADKVTCSVGHTM